MCRRSLIRILSRRRPGAYRNALAVDGHPWPSRIAQERSCPLRPVAPRHPSASRRAPIVLTTQKHLPLFL